MLCVQVARFSALIQQGKTLAWSLVHRLINFLQQELNSSYSRQLFIRSHYMMHILNHQSVSELLETSISVRVLWITNLCPRVLRIINLRSISMVAVAGIINLSLSPLKQQPLSKSSGLSTSVQLSVAVAGIINLNLSPLNHQPQSESFETATSVQVLRIINLGPTLCRSCWNHQPQSESFESPTSVRVLWINNLCPRVLRIINLRSISMVAVAGIINLSLSPLNHQPLSARPSDY